MKCSLGATGTTGRIPVPVVRTGTTQRRTRTTTSVRASFVMALKRSSLVLYGEGRPMLCGQPICPSSENTFRGLIERLVALSKSGVNK